MIAYRRRTRRIFRNQCACRGNHVAHSFVFHIIAGIDAAAQHADRLTVGHERPLVGRRIYPLRAAAHNHHAAGGQFGGYVHRNMITVPAGAARSHHADTHFIVNIGQMTADIQRGRIVGQLTQSFGILLAVRRKHLIMKPFTRLHDFLSRIERDLLHPRNLVWHEKTAQHTFYFVRLINRTTGTKCFYQHRHLAAALSHRLL